MNDKNKMNNDTTLLFFLGTLLGSIALRQFYLSLSPAEICLYGTTFVSALVAAVLIYLEYFSKSARKRQENRKRIKELPEHLLASSPDSIKMGRERDLGIDIYFPDRIRARHVHILGSTGSAKTEGVILNFLKQDVSRGLGAIILDAKGDASFLKELNELVPKEKLKVFDLSASDALTYDPLETGSPLEACQRLFSSLNWSEEYYKSKAFSALQKLFQIYSKRHDRNPRLVDLATYLEDPDAYTAATITPFYPEKLAAQDFGELSGLRDQVKILCTGHLGDILSPPPGTGMKLDGAWEGDVLYFRLQSLLSPQIVSILGKLLINHLNFIAGSAHRRIDKTSKLVPVYMDEFASFACPEFADLISKAGSAKLAIHFAHQSVGQLMEVSKGFLSTITDNSWTKIIMRINDPDTAEHFSRSFGTRLYQKTTQRVTKLKDAGPGEIVGEGTQREAHQFRAPPDLFKGLPTGVGAVLITHGLENPNGATEVFKIKFPRLREEKTI